jgi:acyl-homoserine-lactone acylase
MKTILKRRIPVLLFIVISILYGCNTERKSSERLRLRDRAERVTIIRDKYGVPHIYGKTDADVVFGLMYAQCEDDFNRLEVNYINSMGRMAEVEGESMIFSDLRMKIYIDPEKVKNEYKGSPEWLKKLMNAFADGINFYLITHPEVKPKLIQKFEPWMALTFSEGSIGGDIEQISVRALSDFYREKALLVSKVEEIRPDNDIRGSNGFAIAPFLSATGNALLLINPHTSLFFRSEVHMVSDEGLNAYGAVTWGQFFVYQGFNDKCGWMHTSSKADVIDYYLETIEKKDGKYYYRYGDQLRPFTEKKIQLPYKKGDSLNTKEVTAIFSHHGAVIREENGKLVTVSLMVEHVKALTQSFLRTKAGSYEEFSKVMELRTNSSNNTVYADSYGNISYWHGNFMPVRRSEFDWSKPVDGSNPETDWKGLHETDEMIHILNPGNGWIQNCNSTPFTASGEFSPRKEDYPVYMAPDEENARGIHAVKVLQNQKDFTLEKLISSAYDPFLTAFRNMVPALIKSYDEISANNVKLRTKLSGPVDTLRKWDLKYSANSVATSLAVYWGEEMTAKVKQPVPGTGKLIFDYIAEELPPEALLEGLKNAVDKLTRDFGTWSTAWGEINRYQRLTVDIVQKFDDSKPSLPVGFASAKWGSLASFASRSYPGTKKMYGTSGNSFVAVVEFGKRIRAKSILAGGISGDPGSPHFDDQALMYTIGEFKDVLFYREDIEQNVERKYIPGK